MAGQVIVKEQADPGQSFFYREDVQYYCLRLYRKYPQRRIAEKMLQSGLAKSLIAELTGLSLAEVEALAEHN